MEKTPAIDYLCRRTGCRGTASQKKCIQQLVNLRHEKGQDRNAACADDWAFDPHMERLPRASTGAPRQARHRRTQCPTIETQPSVQPGDPVEETKGREDRLRAFAKARRLAPCTTRFGEHGLAQYLISWFCRLYADLRIRGRVTPIDEISRAEAERHHGCRNGSLALPPIVECRCADCTRDSG